MEEHRVWSRKHPYLFSFAIGFLVETVFALIGWMIAPPPSESALAEWSARGFIDGIPFAGIFTLILIMWIYLKYRTVGLDGAARSMFIGIGLTVGMFFTSTLKGFSVGFTLATSVIPLLCALVFYQRIFRQERKKSDASG
jgi:hypothetical protein